MVIAAPARRVFRIHDERFRPHWFNDQASPAAAPVRGGRFDSLDGSFAYLYAALTERGAFAESFGRNLSYTASGPRPLPKSAIVGRIVSQIDLDAVQLVDLDGGGTQQLGQDDWLTHRGEDGYPLCREWAEAIHRWAPLAHGVTWHSKREPSDGVLMVWGDPRTARSGCGIARNPNISEPLMSGPARKRLDHFLLTWRLYIEP